MGQNDIDLITDNAIIGLYETWQESNIILQPLSRYSKIEQYAKREHARGRAKGGIAVFYRNDIIKLEEVLHNTDNLIACRFSFRNKRFSVFCVYIQPYGSCDGIVKDVFELIENAKDRFYNDTFFVFGDFNARFGNSDQTLTDTFDNLGVLEKLRKSKDAIINSRGTNILQLADNNNLILLNGRSPGDNNGEFTFVAAQGRSVIDIALISTDVINDISSFKVLNIPLSSHLPCQIILKFSADLPITYSLTRLKWKENRENEFFNQFINIQDHSEDMQYETFISTVYKAAEKAGMLCKIVIGKQNSKPWFDKECRVARKNVSVALNQAKYCGWELGALRYRTAQKHYKYLVRKKKEDHYSSVRMNLASIKNAKDFWCAVKIIRASPKVPCQVSDEDWVTFYHNMLPARNNFLDISGFSTVDVLDSDISIQELNLALSKLSVKKSPGPDGITNEFLKNLPLCGREWLLSIYNTFLINESVPRDWATSLTVMLYKKGIPNDPINYRPIALLNGSLKLFTQIFQGRIQKWANDNNIIPECQGGFRPGRGTDDQIFCLNAIINLSLQKKGGKLFSLFIDFQRAFPSIPHNKLYQKLLHIGASTKFVTIIKTMYDNAKTRIKTEHGVTEEIDLTEGLLQGEVLSPILFSLYICEIENILRNSGFRGIMVNGIEIHILCFADDMVMVAPSQEEFQGKIDALERYFKSLDLIVNMAKTKAIIFRKGGRPSKKWIFTYDKKSIEIVNEYTYLGVPFSSTGLFSKAAKHFKQKGMAAAGSVWKVLMTGKMNAFKEKQALFHSIASTVVLYGSHIWALRYMDIVEQFFVQFYKRLLGVSRCTASYLITLETDDYTGKIKVVTQAVKYWLKLLRMEDNRYAKNCFLHLFAESNNTNVDTRYNWVAQMREIFTCFDAPHLFCAVEYDSFVNNLWSMINGMKKILRDKDIEKLSVSTQHSYYCNIIPSENNPAAYLTFNIEHRKLKLLSQARLCQNSILHEKFRHTFMNEKCSVCNFCDNESLKHVLLECKPLSGNVNLFIKQIGRCSAEIWPELLKFDSLEYCNLFYSFLSCRLKSRSFVLEY